jgi:hypothetical protein
MENKVYWRQWDIKYSVALDKLKSRRYHQELEDLAKRWAAKSSGVAKSV